MKKSHTQLLVAAMAGLLLSGITAGCSHKSQGEEARQATPVDVALPQIDSVVIHKSYPGYLIADNEVDVVARVNGYLEAKYFDDGAMVKKGDVLFKIEDTQYRDQLQQAEAQLATAISTHEYASKHYEAMKKALQSDAVSQIDVLQSESALNESVAAIESARAAVQTARTMLGYCTVTAPVSGHVSAPPVTVGDYLSGAASPVVLTTVYDDRKVKAVFSIEDGQYLQIVDNMKNNAIDYNHVPVSFTDTLPQTFTGELCYVAPNITTNTGTMQLQVAIDNKDGYLRAGMYTLVNLPVATDNHAIMVKDISIGTDQLGKYLYVVNDSDKVVYTSIDTGELVNDSMRIVTSGISDSSRYVTKALLKVRTGMTVKPVVEK